MSSSAITGPVLSDVRRSPSGTAAAPSFAFNDSTGTGVYLVSPGVLGLSTAGVQRVVVDASGNLGVGVTPSAWGNTFKALEFSGGASFSADPSANAFITSNAYYDGTNWKYKNTNTAGNYYIAGNTHVWRYAASGTAGNTVSWSTAMILDASGRLSVGAVGSNNLQHGFYGWVNLYRATSTSTDVMFYLSSNVGGTDVLKWRVEADGDTISATGSYTSDERAKKNLAPIQYGLAEIMKLQPKSFNWWHEEDNEVKSFCVSTAQEVQAIMPEMVRDDGLGGPNGEQMKAIYDKELLAVFVKAIQEQQEIIGKLEARLAALESK